MKKILKLLKRRKNSGFTLVEVIISCALLGILIMGVLGMIVPVMSTIMSNEKNANALMIAEAAEAHIDRNIKNSVQVAVYTNAMISDFTGASGKAVASQSMKDMLDFLNDGDNRKIYDMKIIGIRWVEDRKNHQYKYMLTNLTPKIKDDGSGFTSFAENPVFESCFYDNLYPKISFEVMAYDEHEDGDETKPITSTRNVAIRTTIDVYSDPEMKALSAQGKGYADFINIRTVAINRGDIYKLYSIVPGNDSMGNPIENPTQLRTDDEFKGEFGDTAHPETFIVYVTRKLKFVDTTTP